MPNSSRAGAGTDGATTRPNVNEVAFYAQDAWRVTDRLTLNYGARYDLFDYAQPSVQNTNAALLAALGAGACLDQLCERLRQSPRRLSERLLQLELAGLVRGEPGLWWRPSGQTPSLP